MSHAQTVTFLSTCAVPHSNVYIFPIENSALEPLDAELVMLIELLLASYSSNSYLYFYLFFFFLFVNIFKLIFIPISIFVFKYTSVSLITAFEVHIVASLIQGPTYLNMNVKINVTYMNRKNTKNGIHLYNRCARCNLCNYTFDNLDTLANFAN